MVHPLRISGPSMEPSLRSGELRWALRAWCVPAPRRGEVWAVRTPEGEAVKRVVGLPGERLELKEGLLFIDGASFPEPYMEFPESGSSGPWLAGDYFLMGDNRPRSRDSRAWGALPMKAFRGRILGP